MVCNYQVLATQNEEKHQPVLNFVVLSTLMKTEPPAVYGKFSHVCIKLRHHSVYRLSQ